MTYRVWFVCFPELAPARTTVARSTWASIYRRQCSPSLVVTRNLSPGTEQRKTVTTGHIDRCEATDAAHVNSEIEPVPICRFDKCAQRGGVCGTVDQLKELLVFEAVYDAERSSRACRVATRDLERSAVVMCVTKDSQAVAAGSRSQPSSRPTNRRTFRSARTTGEGVGGHELAARKNS